MNTIKRIIFSKTFDFVIDFLEENWDEVIAQGKEYAIGLLQTWRARLLGEEVVYGDDSLVPFDFSNGLDVTFAEAESEAA